MGVKDNLKVIQWVFEARYERGYRYLDRCGDAMVILEEALPEVSDGHVWMTEEMQPKGARMKWLQSALRTFDCQDWTVLTSD